MGGAIARLLGKNREMKILIQGLDAAGKTTVLYRLKGGKMVTTIPTIGFNVETVEHKNISFTAWDVGGRDKMRPLMRHYYPNTQAIIYVIDSNDTERLSEVSEWLQSAMCEDELRNIPLLVYLNKQDLANAISVERATEALKLHQLRCRSWYVQPCVATTGDGLYEGLDFLANAINKKPHPGQVTESAEVAKSYFTWTKALDKFKSLFVAS